MLESDNIDRGGDFTSICIGLILFGNGLIGLFINIHNVVFMLYSRDFSAFFGYLCKARSICNIVNLLLFLIYTAPNTVLKLIPVSSEVGRIAALITCPFYVTIIFIQITVAFNRVVAVLFPLRYNRICTVKCTAMIVMCSMLYGVGVVLTDIISECRYVYDYNEFVWEYQDCSHLLVYIEVTFLVLMAATTSLIVNMFIAVALIVKEMVAVFPPTNKNTRLFWQVRFQELDRFRVQRSDINTCDGLMFAFSAKRKLSPVFTLARKFPRFAQELFFVNDFLWHLAFPDLVDSPWWRFLSSSFMWELAHTCDGLMFVVFEPKMRKSFLRWISFQPFPISRRTISPIT